MGRAKRALPRVVFDYIDGGAEDELTMSENIAAFRDLAFRPRMAVGADTPSLSVRLFGTVLRLPVILAPCGLVRLIHPDGPAGVAKAAASRGTISVLSTHAGAPLEAVASASSGPMWFQLYAGSRKEAESLIQKAASAGFAGLVVTVDTPVLGRRERDIRNGIEPPTSHRFARRRASRASGALETGVGMAYGARDGLSDVRHPHRAPAVPGPEWSQSEPSVLRFSNTASPFHWSDIEWMRGIFKGPLLVKGILTADDAERAVACGADGVIVSNHGGRQLEGAPATLRVLPEIVAAVGDEVEVLVDGGIRRGSDVVKAIALGARAVLVGRPYLYGLAAAGRPGCGTGPRHIGRRDGAHPRAPRLPRGRQPRSGWLRPASSSAATS